MAEQLADAPVAVVGSVHVPPDPPVNVTVPVGVRKVPTSLSVTVPVHDVVWPRVIVDGTQLTDVVVDRLLTVTVVLP